MKKNICIIILLICVLGLGGYIAYDKILKDNDKTNVNNEQKNDNSKDNLTEVNLKESDKIKFENIHHLFQYTLNTSVIPIPKNRITNNEITLSNLEKINMAFYLAINVLNDGSSNFKNDNETEESGSYAVEIETFKKIYLDLFNENLNENNFTNSFYIENNYLYGILPTGWPLSNTSYELDKVMTDNDGKYEIYVNCKDKYDDAKYSNDEIEEMLEDSDSNNFDGNSYQLKIEVQKNDNNDSYRFISIKLLNQ